MYAGEGEKAVELFTRALDAGTEAGSIVFQEAPLTGLTASYTSLGEVQKGLETAERGLSLARRMGHRGAEVNVW